MFTTKEIRELILEETFDGREGFSPASAQRENWEDMLFDMKDRGPGYSFSKRIPDAPESTKPLPFQDCSSTEAGKGGLEDWKWEVPKRLVSQWGVPMSRMRPG